MKHHVMVLCLFLMLAGTTAQAIAQEQTKAGADPQRSSFFLIGNSLTWDTVPSQLDGDTQWHVDCGKSLPYMVANPDEPCVKSSTLWPVALEKKQYDVLAIQVHYGSTLAEDVSAISTLIELQPEARVVIHTGWPRSESRAEEWASDQQSSSSSMSHGPVWFDALLGSLREKHPHRTFERTRAMDLLHQVERDIAAGQAPIEEVADLYRDKIHMNVVTGRYLMHNAMRHSLGQPRSARGFEKLTPEMKVWLDSVLNRVFNDRPPRKVIVGTTMTPWYSNYPGLDARLRQIEQLLDEMSRDSKKKYGRNLDLALFSEYGVTAGKEGKATDVAIPVQTTIAKGLGRLAKQYQCNLVVGGVFLDSEEGPTCANSAIVIDRQGRLAGRYDKVHPVLDRVREDGSGVFEGGLLPGREYNVIDLDIGRVGIQICYDVNFPEGWRVLKEKGAELVLFPTQSPQLTRPAMYAALHEYWVVSSTFRNNASIFEPGTGLVMAQIREPSATMVHEIDLSYVLLPWSTRLRNGEAFREAFGDRVGYRYSESEDRGIFWSNDPAISIGAMAQSLGLLDSVNEQLERARHAQDRSRGGPAR